MVKLWHLPEFDQKNNETRGNIEPFITLRGHTGPLFAASGRGDILFTGGLEGVVKVWEIPQINQVNQYGDTHEGKNYHLADLNLPESDCVWDLAYHPFADLLIQVSANNKVAVWSNLKFESNTEAPNYKLFSQPNIDAVATCATWLSTQ